MAIHTLWLAARAAELGVGWGSILDPEAIAETLEVPLHWKFIGYLCLVIPKIAAGRQNWNDGAENSLGRRIAGSRAVNDLAQTHTELLAPFYTGVDTFIGGKTNRAISDAVEYKPHGPVYTGDHAFVMGHSSWVNRKADNLFAERILQ